MSKNYPRTFLNKSSNKIAYKILFYKYNNPPYDDSWYFYRRHHYFNKGFIFPNKQISTFKYREYRTWKYNRKKQYKNK